MVKTPEMLFSNSHDFHARHKADFYLLLISFKRSIVNREPNFLTVTILLLLYGETTVFAPSVLEEADLKSAFRYSALVIVGVFLTGSSIADGRIWKDHARPYTFLFGNHIDTHQETRIKKNGDLQGFFYVTWLDKDGDGNTDIDHASGLPIVGHCNKPEHYEAGCFAGWTIRAKPCIEEVNGCRAMYLFHYHDHPPWLLDPVVDDAGKLRGSRLSMVQPGNYTHMHWLTTGVMHTADDGTEKFFPSSIADVEAVFGLEPGGINVPPECDVAMAKELTTGAICPGYFLEIRALRSFAFKHGGEPIPVSPGIDNKTHLNLLTSYAPEDVPQEVLDSLPLHGGGHGDDDSGGSGGGDHTGDEGH